MFLLQLAQELHTLPNWREEYVWHEGFTDWVRAGAIRITDCPAISPHDPNRQPSPIFSYSLGSVECPASYRRGFVGCG